MKKAEKNKVMAIGLIISIAAGIYFYSGGKLPAQFICNTYSWDECSAYSTKYDTCYQTCTKTAADCDKCGLDFAQYGSAERWGWKPDEVVPAIQAGSSIAPSWYDSNYRVHYIVHTNSNYDTSYVCSDWTDWGKQTITKCNGYLEIIYWKKTCKSCEYSYQCNPYQCKPTQTCTAFTAKQGPSAPAGAQNVKCSQGFESCGNGNCESQYSENSDNCPADCVKTICTPGQTKCDGNVIRVCNAQQTDWDFQQNCLYGCANNACTQGQCQTGQTQTFTCPDGSNIISANCVSNNWQQTGAQCLAATPAQQPPTQQPTQPTLQYVCSDGSVVSNPSSCPVGTAVIQQQNQTVGQPAGITLDNTSIILITISIVVIIVVAFVFLRTKKKR